MKQIRDHAGAPVQTMANGGWFAAGRASAGAKIGGQGRGVRRTAVPPRSRVLPTQAHKLGAVRPFSREADGPSHIGDRNAPVRAGDRSTPHRAGSRSHAAPRGLTVSTELAPDVAEYPDRGPCGVAVKAGGETPAFHVIGRQARAVDDRDGARP